jgi:hypothetical protein
MALSHPEGRQAANASQSTSVATSTRGRTSQPASSTPRSSATATASASSTSAASTSAASTSAASTGKLPLVVLNNTNTTPGTVAADRFQQAGWTVTSISSFDGAILSTAAYYDPDIPGAEAAAASLQQQFPAIQRVKPKFEGLPQGPIVVILTSDYS